MIGHKSSLPTLKKQLREADVISFKQTEFYQGHTTRWALAWTFYDIDLRTLPEATVSAARKAKPKPPLHYILPSEQTIIKDVTNKLEEMFNKLQMNFELIKESKNVTGYCVTAPSDTWSHQRRRRRQVERLNSVLSDNNNEVKERSECKTPSPGTSFEVAMEGIDKMKVHSPKSPSKRELDDDGFYNCKRVKVALDCDDTNQCYLKTSVVVRKESSNVAIELLFLDGSAGKEGLHQVFQYIKNNLKL